MYYLVLSLFYARDHTSPPVKMKKFEVKLEDLLLLSLNEC